MAGVGGRARLTRNAGDASPLLADLSGAARGAIRHVVRFHALRGAGRAIDGTAATRLPRHRAARPVGARQAHAVATNRMLVARGAVGLKPARVATGGEASFRAHRLTLVAGVRRNAGNSRNARLSTAFPTDLNAGVRVGSADRGVDRSGVLRLHRAAVRLVRKLVNAEQGIAAHHQPRDGDRREDVEIASGPDSFQETRHGAIHAHRSLDHGSRVDAVVSISRERLPACVYHDDATGA